MGNARMPYRSLQAVKSFRCWGGSSSSDFGNSSFTRMKGSVLSRNSGRLSTLISNWTQGSHHAVPVKRMNKSLPSFTARRAASSKWVSHLSPASALPTWKNKSPTRAPLRGMARNIILPLVQRPIDPHSSLHRMQRRGLAPPVHDCCHEICHLTNVSVLSQAIRRT